MINSLPITRPTLLLNRERAITNIEWMAAKARQSGVRFRPHFKTHQSAEIGDWFRAAGVTAITVSSVEMAGYFARHGWSDITIAFPTNILEIEAIGQLARQVKLGLLVESVETVQFLANKLAEPVAIWLKLDVGYGRTGLPWPAPEALLTLARHVIAVPHFKLAGLLTHAGQTYQARSKAEVRAIYQDTVAKLIEAQATLTGAGLPVVALSLGDTPSCSLVNDLSEVDEIRPGNFVFYDLTQLQIGACQETNIAVALACPVVAKHPARNMVITYGGAVHLSKESLTVNQTTIFGYVAELEPGGWGPRLNKAYVTGLSQEHGLIKVDESMMDRLEIGDLLVVLPVHSCLTANLMRGYLTVEDGRFIRFD